jgi:type II secretory pathway pseudopilin PulG
MKNQKGVSLIALIITIIVIIILAAIVMGSGGNTINQANYASFAQQFGEYADQVKVDAATVMAETGKNGKTINNAQKFHMVANGQTDLASGDGLGTFGFQLPVGYVIPDPIKEVLGLTADTTNTTVAYLITDQEINGYEKESNLDFYGDSNGTEYHLVTSDVVVFTIPGFQEEQENGTVRYYITSQGDYYTVEGKTTDDKYKADAVVDGKTIVKLPVQAKDFTTLSGIDYESQPVATSVVYGANLTLNAAE